MRRILIIIAVLLLVLVVGAGSFWAGMTVGENRVIQDPARFFQERLRGQGGQFPGLVRTPQPGGQAAPFGGGIMGTIETVEGDTLLVSTEEGDIRVHTTDTTLIEKYMAVDLGDLAVGEQVVVSGSRNDDGSITARSIRISTVR
ncbi:MAG TPA: hypothetical protein DCP08_09430 [Chloroflexi bacterium]|nr:hypothetical protein [Chloroflexota bacterium]